MTYKFEFTPVSKAEAKQLLDAQKLLMAYATEGLYHLTSMMLDAPDLDEFAKSYEMYQDVAQSTTKLGTTQSIEEAQQLLEQMQKKVQKKLNSVLVSSLEAQLDFFKNGGGVDNDKEYE